VLISTADAEVSPEQRERIERERDRWMAVHRAETEEEARQAAADDEHGAERLEVAAAMTTPARPGESREHAQHRNAERRLTLRRAAAAERRSSAGQAVMPPSVRRAAPRARGAGSPAGRAVARSSSSGGDGGSDDGSGSSEGDPEPPGALEEKFGRSLFHRLARWLARRAT